MLHWTNINFDTYNLMENTISLNYSDVQIPVLCTFLVKNLYGLEGYYKTHQI